MIVDDHCYAQVYMEALLPVRRGSYRSMLCIDCMLMYRFIWGDIVLLIVEVVAVAVL